MKIFKTFAAMPLIALTLCACSDKQVYMEWDVAAVPAANFKVLNAPDFHPSVDITAGPGSGTVTLTCANFGNVYFNSDAADNSDYVNRECGFTMTKTNSNTVKITFEAMGGQASGHDDMVMMWCRDGKNTRTSTVAVKRVASVE